MAPPAKDIEILVEEMAPPAKDIEWRISDALVPYDEATNSEALDRVWVLKVRENLIGCLVETIYLEILASKIMGQKVALSPPVIAVRRVVALEPRAGSPIGQDAWLKHLDRGR